MKTKNEFDPKRVAQELSGFLQDAVGDVASAMLDPMGAGVEEGDKWDRKIKAARKKRVQDLHGWLADKLYNDADTISDLIGDKLHENCEGNKEKQLQVLAILSERTHAGMRKACDSLRKLIEG